MSETTGLLYAYSKVAICNNGHEPESPRYGWLILYTDPVLAWIPHESNDYPDIPSFASLEQELLINTKPTSYSVTSPQYIHSPSLILSIFQISNINIQENDLLITFKDNWTLKFENRSMFQCFIDTLQCHVILVKQTASTFKVKHSTKQITRDGDSMGKVGWSILKGLSSITREARRSLSFFYQDIDQVHRPTSNDPNYLDFFQTMNVPKISSLHSIGSIKLQTTSKVENIEIFSNGGIRPSSNDDHTRKLFWPVILKVYSHINDISYQDLVSKYAKLVIQWQSILPEQELTYSILQDRRHRIQKDVSRTDQHLSFYRTSSIDSSSMSSNGQILFRILLTWSYYESDRIDGYVQGMSDLASPILYVVQDEPLAFWCFAKWMRLCATYFHESNEALIHDLNLLSMLIRLLLPELYSWLKHNTEMDPLCSFCYRWLLVRFKREFMLDPDLLNLWEVLWTNPYSDRYHLFICIGILSLHQQDIINNADINGDELLKYIHHDIKLNLDDVLIETEKLFLRFRYVVQFVDIKELESLIS